MRSLPNMPVELKARLECSSSDNLFRLALDHRLTYMALLDNAWKDVAPVVQWFIDQKLYNDGMKWLYDNIPDCVNRSSSFAPSPAK